MKRPEPPRDVISRVLLEKFWNQIFQKIFFKDLKIKKFGRLEYYLKNLKKLKNGFSDIIYSRDLWLAYI